MFVVLGLFDVDLDQFEDVSPGLSHLFDSLVHFMLLLDHLGVESVDVNKISEDLLQVEGVVALC